MGLEHIFDVELRFRPDMRPVVRPEGREGELVGSGDGTVQGPEIRGTIRWSNFETPGERLCGMYPAGMIETEDGGSLRFDAKGFALRRDGAGTSARWKVAGAMRLETDDPRYAWDQRWLDSVGGGVRRRGGPGRLASLSFAAPLMPAGCDVDDGISVVRNALQGLLVTKRTGGYRERLIGSVGVGGAHPHRALLRRGGGDHGSHRTE
jgi:hypothetical protein